MPTFYIHLIQIPSWFCCNLEPHQYYCKETKLKYVFLLLFCLHK